MRLLLIARAALVAATPSAALADARSQAWRADLEVARSQFLGADRSYSPAARRQAEHRLAALGRSVETLSDPQVAAELARIAALSDNAHTRAYLLRNRGYWRRWPIRIWKFRDGYYVVAARGPGEALLGKRITRIAGRPVETLARALRPLYAGNDRWAAYMSTYTLTSPDALIGAGLLKGDGSATVEAGPARVALVPEPFVPRPSPEESWWFLSPRHPATAGWTHVWGAAPLPSYLSGPGGNYRLVRCDGGVAYLPFNRAAGMKDEPLRAFGERVMRELAADPPARVTLDLRFNTGGDLTQGHPFIQALAASPIGQDDGRLFVVMGQNTFSAGINHAAVLKQSSRARFAGSEPGDELETWAEGGNVVLPNSGLTLHFADEAHTYSKRRMGIPASQVHFDLDIDPLRPDLPADMSFAEYRAGRDRATERILGRPLACPP